MTLPIGPSLSYLQISKAEQNWCGHISKYVNRCAGGMTPFARGRRFDFEWKIGLLHIFPFPLIHELTQVLHHHLMPLFGDALGGGGVYHVFEQ